MRLLDRYLLRELLVPLAYCVAGFFIFWVSFDLFQELSEFQAKRLKGPDVLHYYAVKAPEMLSVVLPVALLLALLYTLTNHARHNELTAIRAAGISLWRLAAPYFLVGLLFSAALFAIDEFWVPKNYIRAEQILNRYDKPVAGTDWQRDLNFHNDAEKRDWHADVYNLKTLTFSNLNVFWSLPDGSRRAIYADSGQWSNHLWRFSNVQEFSYKSANDSTPIKQLKPTAEFPFSETPELFKSEQKINTLNAAQAAKRPQLSVAEVQEYFRLHRHVSDDRAALLKTQLHGRIASAWTCFVIVLIAIPFGAPAGRRNVFVGVAASIFICFAYFILLRLGLTLGTNGMLPAWLAAWLPNILFGVTGIILTLRVR